MKNILRSLPILALVFVMAPFAHAGLSESCYPAVQCDAGQDYYNQNCASHIESLIGASDSCQSLNGAPASGKQWAFNCSGGCYQSTIPTANPCPGGLMIGGQCLALLHVVNDHVPVTGEKAYKLYDGVDLTELVHIDTAGCPDGETAVSDSTSSTGWKCGQASLWSTDGTNVWRGTGNVGIGINNPSEKLSIDGNINMARYDGQDVNLIIEGGDNGIDWTIGNQDSDAANLIVSYGSDLSDPVMIFSTDKNVGIGTATPAAKFAVEASGTGAVKAIYAKGTDSVSGARYEALLGGARLDGGAHAAGLFSTDAGSGSQVFIGTDSNAIKVLYGNVDIQSSLYNSNGSFRISDSVEIGGTASGTMSVSMGLSTIASNNYSVAMGQYTTASGDDSVAMNNGTEASGYDSVAMGYYTEASGTNSFSVGGHTTASGYDSVAMGDSTIASNWAAVAMGQDTTASGGNSVAMGDHTTAQAYASLAIGRYNFIAGSTSSWVNTDPAFVIGNGTSSSRHNAFTVLKNGDTTTDGDLKVYGNASKPGGGMWTNSSDRRLKDIHGKYTKGLNEILHLNPVSFNYKKNNPKQLPSDQEYVGLIAQEVQPYFPEAVSSDADGYLSLNMHSVNVAMINAFQELKSENDALKKALCEIKSDLELCQ